MEHGQGSGHHVWFAQWVTHPGPVSAHTIPFHSAPCPSETGRVSWVRKEVIRCEQRRLVGQGRWMIRLKHRCELIKYLCSIDHSESNADLRSRGYLGDDGTEAAPSGSLNPRGSGGTQSCSKDSSQCQRQCNGRRRTAKLGVHFPPADCCRLIMAAWYMVLRRNLRLDSAEKCFPIHWCSYPWVRRWKWNKTVPFISKTVCIRVCVKKRNSVKECKIEKEW